MFLQRKQGIKAFRCRLLQTRYGVTLRHFASMRELLRALLLSGFNILPDEEWDEKQSFEDENGESWDDTEYQRGWLAAVIAFWDAVADKIS